MRPRLIESAVLGDIAELVMAMATDESQLATHLPRADAIMVFHDLSILGEPASAGEVPRVVRAGVGYNNIELRSRHPARRVVCNVPVHGAEEVADHAIMFLLALVRSSCRRTRRSRDGTTGTTGPPWAAPPAPRQDLQEWSGCGRIGTGPPPSAARRLGLDVVFYDPYLRTG